MVEVVIDVLSSRPVLTFVLVLVVLLFVILTAIWAERKIAARVQMRVGPYHISPRIGGWMQLMADGLRFTFQELIIPRDSDRLLYVLGPPVLLTLVIVPLAWMPYAPNLYITGLGMDVGILLALGILLLSSIVISMIGWASNDRFAYIGAAREALLTSGYEIPLFLSVFSMVLVYETANPLEAVTQQNPLPGAILNPIAFLVYLISVAIATSRFPFEIADYEGDVVLGPYTEYSSVTFMLNMAGPYVALYGYSVLGAVLFLGGWLPAGGGGLMYNIIGFLVTNIKAFVLVILMVFLRSIMPVLRLDHAMLFSWKGLFTLSIIGLLVSVAYMLV